MSPSKFAEFKKILLQKFRLPLTVEQKLASLQPSEIYSLSQEMVITSKQMAKEMAEFLRLPYLPRIGKDAFQLGVLPTGFCKTHFVVPIEGKQSKSAFVLSQPFNWELTDVLRKFVQSGSPLEILITERENIELLFQENAKEDLHDAQGDATIFQDKILRPQPMPIPQGGR